MKLEVEIHGDSVNIILFNCPDIYGYENVPYRVVQIAAGLGFHRKSGGGSQGMEDGPGRQVNWWFRVN